MRDWIAGAGGVDPANLNSTLGPWDAIVDGAVGTPAGGLYSTVAAALAAGAKSIFVRTYAYAAGFNATAGANIVGEAKPYMTGATLAGGPTFGGTIAVPSGVDGVRFENLAATGTSGYGFQIVNSEGFQAVNCIAHDAGSTGWLIQQPSNNRFLFCRAVANGTNGFFWNDSGGVNMRQNVWIGCQSQNNDGPGFILGTSSDASSNVKEATLIGCIALDDCAGYGAAGFSIGPRMATLTLADCHSNEAGSSAAGFYFYSPASAWYRTTLNSCWARANTGAGFQAPGTFNGGMVMTGCHTYGNTGTNYVNMSGFTGYSTCA